MAIKIVVPRLGWTMETGIFGSWLKKDGDPVAVGDMLFTLESDKATQEVESLDGGILRIPPNGPKSGDTLAVGDLLGYLVEPGELLGFETKLTPVPGAEKGNKDPELPHSSKSDSSFSSKESVTPSSVRQPTISPRAARVARELGIDWTLLTGSGQTGRIVERDIRAVASATSTPPDDRAGPESRNLEGKILPFSRMRKIIADRMVAGSQQAAPVTLQTKADATHLVSLRAQFENASSSRGCWVPSYTDLLIKLTATALREHPLVNASWKGGEIFIPNEIHIAIAVDSDQGLVVPVLRNVLTKNLRTIAEESSSLIAKARSGQLKLEDLQNGTFTITNLGMYGIDAFTPILNLPQTAILGVGRIVSEPVVFQGQIVPRDMVTLSLTFDHRAMDGVPAARFLKTLCELIEQPFPWLLD